MRPILTYKRKLCELFPPDDPTSSWMLRLAILRDDLEHEYTEIGQPPAVASEPSMREMWRMMYAARKICVTLEEIHNIFVHKDARAFVNGKRLLYLIPAEPAFDLALSYIDDASAQLKPVRDRLGGHVRPSNSNKGQDPTSDLLRAHGDSELELHLDPTMATLTSLHELNAAALLFAWPDARTDAEVGSRMDALFQKIIHAYTAATRAIDVLLALFWGTPTGMRLEAIK